MKGSFPLTEKRPGCVPPPALVLIPKLFGAVEANLEDMMKTARGFGPDPEDCGKPAGGAGLAGGRKAQTGAFRLTTRPFPVIIGRPRTSPCLRGTPTMLRRAVIRLAVPLLL